MRLRTLRIGTRLLSYLLPAHEALVSAAVRAERRGCAMHLRAVAEGCERTGLRVEASMLRGLADEIAAGWHRTGEAS
jgi:hypothetical protein